MINNRQAGRRNRGRSNNNGRPNGGNNRGGGDSGNRIDNRSRGNAAQLLEKYRNMARDAQLSGDRVNVEYYLQFADHYFRVLADNRARQEEQNPQRFRQPQDNFDDSGNDDFDGNDDFGMDYMADRSQPQQNQPQQQREQGYQRDPSQQRDQSYQRDQSQQRDNREPQQREPRAERFEEDGQSGQGGQRDRNRNRNRNNRDRDFDRPSREAAPAQYEQAVEQPPQFAVEQAQPEQAAPEQAPQRQPRTRRAKSTPVAAESRHEDGLDAAVLPPAISARADNDSGIADVAPAPRKRGRPPRVTTEAAE